MRNSFITIDIDNAIIRFYHSQAIAAGLSPTTIRQLQADLKVLATGLNHEYKTEYTVEVVL